MSLIFNYSNIIYNIYSNIYSEISITYFLIISFIRIMHLKLTLSLKYNSSELNPLSLAIKSLQILNLYEGNILSKLKHLYSIKGIQNVILHCSLSYSFPLVSSQLRVFKSRHMITDSHCISFILHFLCKGLRSSLHRSPQIFDKCKQLVFFFCHLFFSAASSCSSSFLSLLSSASF